MYRSLVAFALACSAVLPAAAEENTAPPSCPTLPELSKALKDAAGQAPVATWLNVDGSSMQLFADAEGHRLTVVMVTGGCAYPVGQGALLRTWAIVGGGEA